MKLSKLAPFLRKGDKWISEEKLLELVNDNNVIIESLAIEMKGEGDYQGMIGFGDELKHVTNLWNFAKQMNASFTQSTFHSCKSAEGWGLKIMIWSPTHFKGWRKYTGKLANWLINL